MAKVAVLVPYPEMCGMAEPLLPQYAHISPMCVEYTRTEEIEERAKTLEQQGCELIVARGLQARLVKRCVRIPVVEICVTAQELGMLVLDIRQELGGAPEIGLIGFDNMLCDTSRFDELFGIRLTRCMADTSEELPALVDHALRSGCQAVIGGDVVCERAEALGLPHRFIPSEPESLGNAFAMAERVCYAIDLEKNNTAEINTMLNFTFSGIVQVDMDGKVLRANRVVFQLLECRPADLIGKHVLAAIPQLTQEVLDKALKEGEEAYAFLMLIRKKAILVNIAPILTDGGIHGGILTFQEDARIIEMDGELRRELYQRGYIAKCTFDRIPSRSRESQQLTALAKQIAKYNAPVLLTGEAGCGKALIAQCIHNESVCRGNAFVALDCSAYQPDTLDTILFGNYTTRKDTAACAAETAQDGTLYLSHIEMLSPELQYKVLDLIHGRFLHNGASIPSVANVRVIASSNANLMARVQQREFRGDLYYALGMLRLEFLPLRRRREDILGWVDFYMKIWQERCKRYVTLTQGSRDFLESYDWPGNLDQVASICASIVLLTERRNVDEGFLRQLLEQSAPTVLQDTEQVVLFKDKKAIQISELLQKYHGNRQRVADELGISKTTLWRNMKKYGIGQDYSY